MQSSVLTAGLEGFEIKQYGLLARKAKMYYE